MVGVWRWMGVCWAKYAKLDPNVFGLKLPKSRKSGFWASCKFYNILTGWNVPKIKSSGFYVYQKGSNDRGDFCGMPSSSWYHTCCKANLSWKCLCYQSREIWDMGHTTTWIPINWVVITLKCIADVVLRIKYSKMIKWILTVCTSGRVIAPVWRLGNGREIGKISKNQKKSQKIFFSKLSKIASGVLNGCLQALWG